MRVRPGVARQQGDARRLGCEESRLKSKCARSPTHTSDCRTAKTTQWLSPAARKTSELDSRYISVVTASRPSCQRLVSLDQIE